MNWIAHPFVVVLASATVGALGAGAAEPTLGLMGVVGSGVIAVGGVVAGSMLWVLRQNREARDDFVAMLREHAETEEKITKERTRAMLAEMRRLISDAKLGRVE